MNLQLVSGFLFACQPIGLLIYSVGPIMLKRAEEDIADHCRWFIQIGTTRPNRRLLKIRNVRKREREIERNFYHFQTNFISSLNSSIRILFAVAFHHFHSLRGGGIACQAKSKQSGWPAWEKILPRLSRFLENAFQQNGGMPSALLLGPIRA